MSYDLNFWRYEDEGQPRSVEDHIAVYKALCEGEGATGLAELPTADISKSLRSRAPTDWIWEDNTWLRQSGGAIEILLDPYWVRFDLYGSWTGDDANWLIAAMKTFGCPLFDPQVPERFVL